MPSRAKRSAIGERWRALHIRPHIRSFESIHAGLVGLYWAWIRGVETETCQRCGHANLPRAGSWWHADDADWISVMGHSGGVLCMRCFVRAWEAEHPGRLMFWKATPEVSGG